MKIGIAILLTMVAQWVMNVANNKITYSVVRDIRTDAFEKIQVLPLSYIDSPMCIRDRFSPYRLEMLTR